jgi:hypothetical protein
MKRTVLLITLAPLFTACSTVNMSARLECSDNWGRTIPKEQRTADNCWALSHRVLVEQGRDIGAGSGYATSAMTGTHTYITPAGTYQVSRVGSSTTIVTQTARGRR